jgi:hypothetical protein
MVYFVVISRVDLKHRLFIGGGIEERRKVDKNHMGGIELKAFGRTKRREEFAQIIGLEAVFADSAVVVYILHFAFQTKF